MDKYLREWIAKAEKDLKAAEHELSFGKESITEAVCFHAQQAAEKYLKAFLALKGKGFPKTHNLYLLKKLCSEIDPEFRDLRLGNLQFYAVKVRYPDDFYTPTLEEAEEAYSIALSVRDFVRKKLGLE